MTTMTFLGLVIATASAPDAHATAPPPPPRLLVLVVSRWCTHRSPLPLVRRVNKAEITEASKINKCMTEEQTESMEVIYEAIREGADAFLMAEYKICFLFVACFGAVIFFLIGLGQVRSGPLSPTSL